MKYILIVIGLNIIIDIKWMNNSPTCIVIKDCNGYETCFPDTVSNVKHLVCVIATGMAVMAICLLNPWYSRLKLQCLPISKE